MATLTNGNRPAVRLSLPTIGAISSILGVVVFVAGFALGYLAFKAEMTALAQNVLDLRQSNMQLQERLNNMSALIAQDRENLGGRLTGLERDIQHIDQDIAELKLKAGTNR